MPKGDQESAKTHCPQGHEYSPENTRVSAGSRFCRACDREKRSAKRREGGRVVEINAAKTHCPAGHEYTEANTRVCKGMRFCRACDREKHVSEDIAHPERPMWDAARHRAKKHGVPFEIQLEDIVIPPCCPVLGIPLQRGPNGRLHDASPSLDRTEPSKGYVRGNVAVISYKANRIKSNANLEELERVAAWLRADLKGRTA